MTGFATKPPARMGAVPAIGSFGTASGGSAMPSSATPA